MPALSTVPAPRPIAKIAHLMPHLNPYYPRMFQQARSSVEDGFEVVVIAPHDRDEEREGVRVLGVPHYRSRLERVTRTNWLCLKRALAERPDIYYLHTPDQIPWGLLLRLIGRKVAYDVLEDYKGAAMVRTWLPDWARTLTVGLINAANFVARKAFVTVIAERYYARDFPEAIQVLNYAREEDYVEISAIARDPASLDRIRLIYAGSITDTRGGRHHARLLPHLPENALLRLIGQCPLGDVRAELEAIAARDPRLDLVIRVDWVPRDDIIAAYREPYTAGLAIFPDTVHYREKELTKLFEYMAAGLPVVASNFPVWRELIEDNEVGLCVDPEDPAAAVAAIRWLSDNPEVARRMGTRGRELVRERFNWASQARALNDLYRRMLDRTPIGAGATPA